MTQTSVRPLECHLSILRNFAWAAFFLVPCIAQADSRMEELKRCLRELGGIEWKLPYQPPMHIRSCASATANYDTSEKAGEGRGVLELIGELTLGPDTAGLSSDEVYAALQNASYTHFDVLFRRHGYRRTALEYGDARTRYHANTLRMLRGQRPLSEQETEADEKRVAAEPPIPYVNLARYVRPDSGREATLIYKTDAKNTWRITIDGMTAANPPQGKAP